MNEYQYLISNGHHLVKIDDRIFLIDTGSPDSFALKPDMQQIIVNDRPYVLPYYSLGVVGERTCEFIGVDICGLLGLDFLRWCKSIVFNRLEMSISFGSNIISNTEIDFTITDACETQFIQTEVEIENKELVAAFDTGACVGYVREEDMRRAELYKEFFDYGPMFGNIYTELYSTNFKIGEYTFNTRIARMTEKIKRYFDLLGCRAIIGLNDFGSEIINIDFENQKIRLTKNVS